MALASLVEEFSQLPVHSARHALLQACATAALQLGAKQPDNEKSPRTEDSGIPRPMLGSAGPSAHAVS